MLSQSVLCPYGLKRVEGIGVESPKSCNGLILQKIRRANHKPLALGWLTRARLQQCAPQLKVT